MQVLCSSFEVPSEIVRHLSNESVVVKVQLQSLAAGVSVSLGKGAWDCDAGCAIPPEKEVRASISMLLANNLVEK